MCDAALLLCAVLDAALCVGAGLGWGASRCSGAELLAYVIVQDTAMHHGMDCGAVFKGALGFFDKWHELPAYEKANLSIWDAAGHWSWRTFEASCPVNDFLSSIIKGELSTWPRPRLKVLLAGDSLDRHIIEFICALPESRKQGFQLHTLVHPLSQARECSHGHVRLISYKLFGLVEPSQVEMAEQQELREPHNLTLDADWRLSKLLQQDVPDIHNFEAIIVNSCLWDLSHPVTTSDPLTMSFGIRYAQRVEQLSLMLRAQYPNAMLHWRTCPPTNDKVYPQKAKLVQKANITRTQRSQAVLNNAVMSVVHRQNHTSTRVVSNGVLDWAHMLAGYSILATDGRHYPEGPSLAFFNLFLNALRWDMRAASTEEREERSS